jgi:hypothetical protein
MIIVAGGIFLGYYHLKKKEKSLTKQENIILKEKQEENKKEDGIKIPKNGLVQWAIRASASSAYGSREEKKWSEDNLTGEPDVIEYGDCENAWAPESENKGIEWIELGYQTSVYATAVRICESYNPGVVIKLELKDEKDKYHTLWVGEDETSGLDFLDITFLKTNFKTNTIRITLDTQKVPGWNEIDAVALIGIP